MSPLVLLICPGGLERQGGIGRQMGYLIDAWSAQADGPVTVIVDPRGPGHVAWSPFWLASALLRILWIVTTRRVWVVHVNLSERASIFRKMIVVALVRVLRRRIVLHLHGARFIEFFAALPPWLRRPVRQMFKAADCVIVLGNLWREHLIDCLNVCPRRIEILYNAVPIPPPSVGRSGREDACRVLFLGDLSDRKGVPELLAGLATPVLRRRAWELRLAGGGPIARYRAQASELGLGERAEFLGWIGRDQVAALLGWADLLVLPSRNEGLPLAVIEAMAAGVAVIATPVGAIPEFFVDGECGLLVPPGDPGALAVALERLIDDPALRQRLAAGAADVFKRNFSLDRYGERMLEIYRRHCGPPPGESAGARAAGA